jgi:hypothetical protein
MGSPYGTAAKPRQQHFCTAQLRGETEKRSNFKSLIDLGDLKYV